MRAVIEVYRGDQEELVTLDEGQLVTVDETYSVRLVDVDDTAAIGRVRGFAAELDEECPWTSDAPYIADRLRKALEEQP
jgi:hypothetical protein